MISWNCYVARVNTGDVPAWKIAAIALLHLPSYVEPLIGFAVLVGSIAALLNLNRRSELVIVRAGGMSVWQFLLPGMIVASGIGLFELTIYNPMAARALARSAQIYVAAFGRDSVPSELSAGWLRQDGIDGESVINTRAATNHGRTLAGVTVFAFDAKGHFSQRIDASRADLQDGAWLLTNAWVSGFGYEPKNMISTYWLRTSLPNERPRRLATREPYPRGSCQI